MPTKRGRPKNSTKTPEERENAWQLRLEKACKTAAKEKETAGLRASMSQFVVQPHQAPNDLPTPSAQEQNPSFVSTREAPV